MNFDFRESLVTMRTKGGVKNLHQYDTSQVALERLRYHYSHAPNSSSPSHASYFTPTPSDDTSIPEIRQSLLTQDSLLPLIDSNQESGIYDLVTSNLNIHWVNDLPSLLFQVQDRLRPDGLALLSVFGGDTLMELRDAFLVAEQEREGRVSVRVSPMVGVADAGSLLGKAKFALTTVDAETIVINYRDIFQLMEDLRGMGESNAAVLRGPPLKRSTLFAAASAYQALYGNEDGTIPATFQIFFLTGWKPSENQQQPKRRGSASYSLKNLEDVDEIQNQSRCSSKKTFSLSDLGQTFQIPLDEDDNKK
jgi:NADH dehydrogenase [ubiquinone] 1 alpha subcomplex assembly factor 5